jgi:HD superfamily phosphodiesterase
MNLTVTIESAETRFKQILEAFFISIFDEKSLTSHGIDHHRRVWNYSKELYNLIAYQKPAEFSNLLPKLIIASYLHDIGMTVEKGPKHGKHSKELCVQFLVKNNFRPDDYQDVLETIENHDNKDYPGNSSVNDLLTILSAADDLDAFGFTGIFRYSEIYLTRGISPDQIGNLINQNAAKRFDNFAKTFGFASEYVEKHKKRFERINNFFEEYNKQVLSYKFGESTPTGYCGVIEIFTDIMNSKISLKDVCMKSNIYCSDSIICLYFNNLAKEPDICL